MGGMSLTKCGASLGMGEDLIQGTKVCVQTSRHSGSIFMLFVKLKHSRCTLEHSLAEPHMWHCGLVVPAVTMKHT